MSRGLRRVHGTVSREGNEMRQKEERGYRERESFTPLSHLLWRDRIERTQRVGTSRREVFPRFEARHSRSVCGSRKGYAPLCACLALPTNTIRHPQPQSCRRMTIPLNPIYPGKARRNRPNQAEPDPEHRVHRVSQSCTKSLILFVVPLSTPMRRIHRNRYSAPTRSPIDSEILIQPLPRRFLHVILMGPIPRLPRRICSTFFFAFPRKTL